MNLIEFIRTALDEDIRDGDHSTLACIPPDARGKAELRVKERGRIAGIDEAQAIFHFLEPSAVFTALLHDGQDVEPGDQAFTIEAGVHTILKAERLVLNIMQRMSGIATLTQRYVSKIQGCHARLLDTRKTTPNFRAFEKKAVTLGGGYNHRFGLYDMIMLKDNHIDFCGGIEQAIDRTRAYLASYNLSLPVEVETRNIDEVRRVVAHGGVQRIMLDNFQPEQIREALSIIQGRFETEASGGINLDTIRTFAETGVDFISAGAIIHHAVSMDLSLKAMATS